jgi:protein SCO1/2
VLFVSVDPQRDTVAVLKRYVKNFGPHVVGLRPDDQELRQLAARYRVAYGYGKADADGNYEVSHSSAVFIFGPHGRARLLTSHADKTDVITTDLRRLIAEG